MMCRIMSLTGSDDQAALVQIWQEDQHSLMLDYAGILFGVVPPTFALFRNRWILRSSSRDPTGKLKSDQDKVVRLTGRRSGLSPPVVHLAGLRIFATHTGKMHAVVNLCQGFLAAVYDALGRSSLNATRMDDLKHFRPIGPLTATIWPLAPEVGRPSAVSPCSPPKAPEARGSWRLEVGQFMAQPPASSLASSSGAIELVLAGDAQLCLRRRDGVDLGCWPSRKLPESEDDVWKQARSGIGDFDSQVELKLFTGSDTAASDRWRRAGLFFLSFQRDGNLCMYRGTGPQQNQGAIWCLRVPRCAMMACSLLLDDASRLVIVLGMIPLWQLHFPANGSAPARQPLPLKQGSSKMSPGDYLIPCLSSLVSSRATFELTVVQTQLCRRRRVVDGELICLGPAVIGQAAQAKFVMVQADGSLCMFAGSGPWDNLGVIWCIAEHAGKCAGPPVCSVVLGSDGALKVLGSGLELVGSHRFEHPFDESPASVEQSSCLIKSSDHAVFRQTYETGWQLHQGQALVSSNGLHQASINPWGQMCTGGRESEATAQMVCFPPLPIGATSKTANLILNHSGHLCATTTDDSLLNHPSSYVWCALLLPCVATACSLTPVNGDVLVNTLADSHVSLYRCLSQSSQPSSVGLVAVCVVEVGARHLPPNASRSKPDDSHQISSKVSWWGERGGVNSTLAFIAVLVFALRSRRVRPTLLTAWLLMLGGCAAVRMLLLKFAGKRTTR